MTNIIIIGAGISGLAAARELQSNGFKVTVLEGRNRIGGRINTDRTLGLPVDLGASWIHGINNNPIGKLAQEFQVPILLTDWDNWMIYNSNNGQPLKEKELQKSVWLYAQIMEQLKSLKDHIDHDISVSEAIKIIIEGKDIEPEQKNILKWYFNLHLVEDATDLENLSLREWWQWDETRVINGNDYLVVDGYDQIIQKLAKGIDIQLQQKVIEIEYNNKGVSIKTDRGTFEGDAAVVTLTLGVLKSGTVNFSPFLPDLKIAAINRLSMGVLNKIVLKFPKIFWPKDYHLIGYLSSNEKDFSHFLNLYKYTSTAVLVALTGGSFARSLEELSDREAGEKVMELLRNIYGNSIPNPEAIIRTKWAVDPFSFGSYSAIPVGAKKSDRAILAESISDRLFFAGEATSSQYPSTVHGAFLSGLREAENIRTKFQA